MIPVTKPFSPPIHEYQQLLEGIWKRNWFTNNGPLVNDLELKLKNYLNQKHLLFVSNGTIAIQIALKALGITKKVITTPFSYVATTSSLVWEGCTPVYADIDKETLNIDPNKIEELIDDDTEAILATHCFGNPCDIESINQIAQKYRLKVIYDAAHCFGSEYEGKSVFAYGDISTTSFHATKLFHTIEGGAVFTQDPTLIRKMAYMRNFGHDGPEKFNGVGINGKNSELHAAMGIVNLNYVEDIINRRRLDSINYDKWLVDKVQKIRISQKATFNFAYYPIIFKSKAITLLVMEELIKREIFPRRYFYPSLSSLDYVENQNTPICNDLSSRILCLPLYYDLTNEEIDLVCRIILRTLNN